MTKSSDILNRIKEKFEQEDLEDAERKLDADYPLQKHIKLQQQQGVPSDVAEEEWRERASAIKDSKNSEIEKHMMERGRLFSDISKQNAQTEK